jgi:hypothetical protein
VKGLRSTATKDHATHGVPASMSPDRSPASPRAGLALAGALLLSACRQPAADSAGPTPSAVAAHEHAALVAAAAAHHTTFGRVDGLVHRAPTDCRAPLAVEARLSQAAGAGAHAAKLYRLWARDPDAYRAVASGASQAGQVLVKESFEHLPCEMPGPGAPPLGAVVLGDGSLARLGPPTGLFVMVHVGGVGESAWIYGTTTPDGEVGASGRLASCRACHVAAPYDGLFGPVE